MKDGAGYWYNMETGDYKVTQMDELLQDIYISRATSEVNGGVTFFFFVKIEF